MKRSSSSLWLALLLPALVLAACSRSAAPSPAPIPEAGELEDDLGAGGGAGEEAAGVLEDDAPRPIPIRAEARTSGDSVVLFGDDEELPADLPLVDPAATFVLESASAFPDLRVRLFDRSGRIVPTEDEISIGRGSRYLLRPTEALEASETFRLFVDGAQESRVRDVEGEAYRPRSFRFRTSAEESDEP